MELHFKLAVIGLLILQVVWLANAEGGGVSGGGEVDVTDCNDTCTEWERCVVDDNSSLALQNLGELPKCVLTNECENCREDKGWICCGHDHCYCPWPTYKNYSYCRECDCASNQLCLTELDGYLNGSCICDDQHVADGSECVRCNPDMTCPDCPEGKLCTFAPGNPVGTCECPPEQVETKDGDCVECLVCPEECPLGQVCLTNLTSMDTYCGCLPGTRLKNGKCVSTPVCPQCNEDEVCVIHGAEAVCECPEGTVWQWEQCMPIAECPECPDNEVCVIPHDGQVLYCKCKEGYIRTTAGTCVTCSRKQDECYGNQKCPHGKVCTNGVCECPKNYTPKWGKCIRPGMAGGLCKNGDCYGKHVRCGSSGYCECAPYAYKEPQPICIKK